MLDVLLCIGSLITCGGFFYEIGVRRGFHKGVQCGNEELYHRGFRDGLAKGMLGGDKDVICVASVCGKDIEK